MTDVVDGQSRAVSTSELPEYFILRRDTVMALRRMERMLRILLAPTKLTPTSGGAPRTTRRPPGYWGPVQDGRSMNQFDRSVDVG